MSFPVELDARPVYRGDSVSWPFTIWADVVGGSPRDLSEWSGWVCQWRPYPDSVNVIDLTVVVVPLLGMVTVTVSTEQSLSMGRSGVFDLQSSGPTGVRTWVSSSTDYQKDVSRND